jgi:hypothetical protein
MAVVGFAEISVRNRPSAELSDRKRNVRGYLNASLLGQMEYLPAPKVMVAEVSGSDLAFLLSAEVFSAAGNYSAVPTNSCRYTLPL